MREWVPPHIRNSKLWISLRLLRRQLLSKFGISSTPEQWLRIVMNRETRKLIESLDPKNLKVLEISGNYWNQPGLFKDYESVHFPHFDICSQLLEDRYDLIIAEQVFEHLLWPYRAGRNVYSMLKANGAFLITTPFLIRIHKHPHDCNRWTETGMKYFLVECGFPLHKIHTASWGNRACVRGNLSKDWQMYRFWRHSLKNESDYPVVVWSLARK